MDNSNFQQVEWKTVSLASLDKNKVIAKRIFLLDFLKASTLPYVIIYKFH